MNCLAEKLYVGPPIKQVKVSEQAKARMPWGATRQRQEPRHSNLGCDQCQARGSDGDLETGRWPGNNRPRTAQAGAPSP
jgi:hypothetical protein